MLCRDLNIPHEQIAEFCRKNRIRRLALFGSVLREDFRSDSNIDVLVEFEPGATPGFRFFGLQQVLTALSGRTVDLNTPGFLSKYFRESVLRESEPLYEAA